MAAKRKAKQNRKKAGAAGKSSPVIKLVQIVTGLSMAFFIVALSVTIALNSRWIYANDIKEFDLEKETDLTTFELMQEYDALVKYNNLFGPEKLSFIYFDMSDHGRQHFEEVRAIFHGLQTGGIVSFFIMISGIIFLAKKKAGAGYLLISSLAPLSLLVFILGSFFVIGWDRCFVLFHKIFFDNDYWLFDARYDPVINALPDGFFFHEAAFTVFLAAFFSAVEFIIYRALKKRR